MLPSRRFLVLASLGLLPALLAPIWDGGFVVAVLWLLCCSGVAAASRVFGVRSEEIEVERQLPRSFSLGETAEVTLRVRNHAGVRLRIEVMDAPPDGWDPEGLPAAASLAPGEEMTLTYRVTPDRRGQHRFGSLYTRVEQAPGLLLRQWSAPADARVRVYPDLKEVARYELMARRSHLGEFGVHRMRIAGQGSEFERLRDYSPDDDYRRIDWKGTARRRQPVSRVYEVERSQNVLLVVDAGRMMAARSGKYTRLDRAVNSALMLAHVVLKAGDRVGLLVVADGVEAYLPPGKGANHFRVCLDLLYGVEARYCYVDYAAAVQHIVTRCRRRSLVVFFTDLVDEETSGELVQSLRQLRPRHLPLCVTMRDPTLLEAAALPLHTEDEFFERAAALELLDDRRHLAERLHREGALVLECDEDQLSVQVVNRYLELKARQAL